LPCILFAQLFIKIRIELTFFKETSCYNNWNSITN